MDLPVDQILKHAEETIAQFGANGSYVEVRFKATCPACGERLMAREVNTWHERWECEFCGVDFVPTGGGYALFAYLGPPDQIPKVKKEVMRILEDPPPTQ